MAGEQQDSWVTRVLGVAIPRSGPEALVPKGAVRFAKLRLAWQAAKSAVGAELDKLRQTVASEMPDHPLLPALSKLDGVLGHFHAGLSDALDALANAPSAEARAAAGKIAGAYAEFTADSELIELIESNPFMPVLVAGRLYAPLQNIRAALAA